jgi:hypothetical protein
MLDEKLKLKFPRGRETAATRNAGIDEAAFDKNTPLPCEECNLKKRR